MWPVWGLIHALFDMKFLTVFSFLFGLGFALQWQKARQWDTGSQYDRDRRPIASHAAFTGSPGPGVCQ
jgi:uncharacterized membrane protein YeiB